MSEKVLRESNSVTKSFVTEMDGAPGAKAFPDLVSDSMCDSMSIDLGEFEFASALVDLGSRESRRSENARTATKKGAKFPGYASNSPGTPIMSASNKRSFVKTASKR